MSINLECVAKLANPSHRPPPPFNISSSQLRDATHGILQHRTAVFRLDDDFLAYSEAMVSLGFPPSPSSLYILKRGKHADGSPIGDVIPLCQLRRLLDLVPRFNEAAHRSFTDRNSSSYSAEFSLNKYFDKDSILRLAEINSFCGLE